MPKAKPTKKATKKPTKKSTKKSAKQPAKKAVKKATKKPTKQAAKPTKKATKPKVATKTARAKPAKQGQQGGTGPKKLIDAASSGNLDVVTALLAAGCDPNVMHQESAPLAWAVWKGHGEVAKALIASGANPNIGRSYPCAGGAMHAAADRGSVEMLQLLFDAGGDANVIGQDESCRPLFKAANRGHAAAVALLLERGADSLLDVDGDTAMMAAASGGSVEVLELLHARGAPLRSSGRPPLIQAVYSGKPDAARWFLAHGCDPNEREAEETALHVAAGLTDGAALIDVLVAGGAELEARVMSYGDEPPGATALQIAVHEGYPANVARLLHHGADHTAPTHIPDWPTMLDMAKHHLDAHPPETWGDGFTRIVEMLQKR